MRSQKQTDDQVQANLETAIRRMREACDDAERLLESDRSSESKIGGVMTKFAWAHANATTHLDNALNKLESRRVWIEVEREEEAKQ